MSLAENEFVTLLSPDSLEALIGLSAGCPPGDFVEIGVYQGGSALFLYQIAQDQGRCLHLFDTFEGMPIAGEFDAHKVGDFADVDFDRIRRVMPKAMFYKGFFPDTMPKSIGPVAFVHVDCDQYQSVKDSIERMWPLVVDGGIMLFDDYSALESAKRAVDEVFPSVFLTNRGKAFVVKGHVNGFSS